MVSEADPAAEHELHDKGAMCLTFFDESMITLFNGNQWSRRRQYSYVPNPNELRYAHTPNNIRCYTAHPRLHDPSEKITPKNSGS